MRPRMLPRLSLMLCLAWLTTWPVPSAAEPAKTADGSSTASGSVDPRAADVLRRVGAWYGAARRLSTDLTLRIHVVQFGMSQNMETTYSVAVERPDKFALILQGETIGGSLVSNGKTVFTHLPALRKYTEEPAPAKFSEYQPDMMAGNMIGFGMLAALQALTHEDPAAALLQEVTSGTLIGRETVNGRAADHLALSAESADWQFWIAAEGDPEILKISTDPTAPLRRQAGMENRAAEIPQVGIMAEFHPWKINPALPADAFVLRIPQGHEKIDSFMEAMGGGEGGEEKHPALGEKAPEFELDTLNGEKFRLADHLGKAVIMLDFWATWCGPCVRALPEISATASAYKDRGVVFYAVNLREEPADIRKFLANQKLDIPVLLDREGTVGDLFHVEGIPQTVLIGRDGKVQVVHVGLLPGLRKRLSGELDSLLAGKDLAGDTTSDKTETTATTTPKN